MCIGFQRDENGTIISPPIAHEDDEIIEQNQMMQLSAVILFGNS